MLKYFLLFCSKGISFATLFVFATYLTKEEVGSISYYQSIQFFLSPILSIQLGAAVFRFYTHDNKRKSIDSAIGYSNLLFFFSLFFLFIYFIIDEFYIGILSSSSGLAAMTIKLEEVRRKRGDERYFSLMLFQVMVFLVIAMIFILVVSASGLRSVLISEIISQIFIIIIIFRKGHFNLSFKMLLQYSIPLIPNSVCWWVLNSGMIFIVSNSYGAAVLSEFSVNYKVPSVLIIFSSMVLVIWQRNFIDLYENKKLTFDYIKKKFIFFSISVFVILFVLSVSNYFFIKEFYKQYVIDIDSYILICLVVYVYCINLYCGIQYIITCNTKRASIIMMSGGSVTFITGYIASQLGTLNIFIATYFLCLSLLALIRGYDYISWSKEYA